MFHFMLDGSNSRGLAQLNFSYVLAKSRKTSVRQSNLHRLSFLVGNKIHCAVANANACPLLEE